MSIGAASTLHLLNHIPAILSFSSTLLRTTARGGTSVEKMDMYFSIPLDEYATLSSWSVFANVPQMPRARNEREDVRAINA